MTEFNKGDRVRVTFEGVVGFDGRITHEEQSRNYFDTRGFTVELIERAKSPAETFRVGSIVKNPPFAPFVKIGQDLWAPVGGSEKLFSNAHVTRMHFVSGRSVLIGTVPGTPAATEVD